MALFSGLIGETVGLFGGGSAGQSYAGQQTVMNSILQESNQSCSVKAQAENNENVLVVSNSSARYITGVEQSVTSDITCSITSTMDATVENLLSNSSKQSIEDSQGVVGDIIDIFKDGDTQSVDMSQYVSNAVSQITNATCQSSTITSASNNLLIVTNSRTSDVVGVSTNTSAQATCILQNVAKTDLVTKLGLINDQDIVKKSAFWEVVKYIVIGALLIIALVIIMMIIPSGGGDSDKSEEE